MIGERPIWKSRIGFILAAAGSAIGLGNIWKFPYIAGENGGGLFVLIYLVCVALVGIPIMMAEIMIGRAGQRQPIGAFHAIELRRREEAGESEEPEEPGEPGEPATGREGRTPWAAVGWLGVVAGFVILSYYIVVAGWALDYALKSAVNFTRPIHAEAEIAATEYRAVTDVDTMRRSLADWRAEHLSRDAVSALRSRAKPSVWKDYERYESALRAASPGAVAAARARLRSDPTLDAQVGRAEALIQEIGEVRAKALEEARAHYAALPDSEVLAAGETQKRREVTFERVQRAFLSMASDGWTSILWSAVFMFVTILIVAGGISRGIERTCKLLMPTLLILIIIMVLYGTTTSGFGQAVSFVFRPAPEKLKASGVLEALGHAFFTLSLGMGAMITYGSYQKTKERIVGQSITIALLDTVIALLACMMIYPIIFSYGQDPTAGPGLVFQSMPLAFAEIGRGGMLLAILFFGLLVFAALTSAISLLEVVASYFIDECDWSRARAAWTLGGVIFLFAIPSAFSLDPDVAMSGWEPSFGKNFFDTMDYLATNWLLPTGGLFLAVYAGWVMPARLRNAELADASRSTATIWLLLTRWVAPALVVLVLLQKVGILDADELFHGIFN